MPNTANLTKGHLAIRAASFLLPRYLGFKQRILAICKQWGLRRAEDLAYDVVGLPMALQRLRTTTLPSVQTAPAAYLHAIYGDAFWRRPGLGGRLRMISGLILWPIALPIAVGLYTYRNGAAIEQRVGKSLIHQMREQVSLAARYSIAPYWYYMFELYDEERRRLAPFYLHRHETKGPIYSLLQPPSETDAMADKAWFSQHCRDAGVAVVPVLLLASSGEIMSMEGQPLALPTFDLFVKPRQGRGGRNTARWDYVGSNAYRNSDGEVLDNDELMKRLALQSAKLDYIVQPRLTNHEAITDLSNGALATVRVLTCRNEEGAFEATDAAFRMAVGNNNVVDNFHAGGIAAAVEMATGELGAASDMGLRPDIGWRNTHPNSGAAILGRRLPLWSDVLDLACRAHAAFPKRAIVGWDIGILADGPRVIEGNIKPDLDIHQRIARRPLGGRRAAELLAFNVWNTLGRLQQ
jgi:hypothetical protein